MTDLRNVFDNLVRFETMLWESVDNRLKSECDVTLSTVNLMLVIAATPDCRVFDIAEALAITVGGTSQAVDRLERAGSCVRRPHPTDRRSSIVELTPTGVAVLRRAEPVFDDQLARLIEVPLSGPSLTGFDEALGILRRSFAR